MSADYLARQLERASRKRSQRITAPPEPRVVPAFGRIIALTIGQGTGFIRVGADDRVFFHRADVQDGSSINDFEPGDAVDFDLVADPVSGARALRVRPRVAIPSESRRKARS